MTDDRKQKLMESCCGESEYDIHCNEAVRFYDDDDYDALADEWRESQLKQLRDENERLQREVFEIRFARPIWGFVGFMIGSSIGAFWMWFMIEYKAGAP